MKYTKEEYEKAKAIVDAYELQEIVNGQRNEDWFLLHEDDEDDEHDERDYECPVCGGTSTGHGMGCPEDDSPFARLIRDGYD